MLALCLASASFVPSEWNKSLDLIRPKGDGVCFGYGCASIELSGGGSLKGNTWLSGEEFLAIPVQAIHSMLDFY